MWKILAVISAVLLGAAAYFAYENHKVTEQKIKDLDDARRTLQARQEQLDETIEEIAMLNQSIMNLQDETERLNTEKIDLDNKVVQAQSELRLLETQTQTAQATLDRSRKLIASFPDIESIRRQMADTRTAIEETEIEITQLEGQNAAIKGENVKLESAATELEALSKDQANGIIRGPFESTIAKAYNQWGFVVINGGDDQGVVHDAQLDVYRRGQFICKLFVTEVEANQSVADIVPGSLQTGQSVLAGDTVVKTIQPTLPAVPADGATVAPAPTPDNAGGQPAPAPQPANDPFGGGGMNGGGNDPFGGGNDPFGGGGGGGGMNGGAGGGGGNDPFGGGGGGGMNGGGNDPFGGGDDPFGR